MTGSAGGLHVNNARGTTSRAEGGYYIGRTPKSYSRFRSGHDVLFEAPLSTAGGRTAARGSRARSESSRRPRSRPETLNHGSGGQ